MPKISVLMGIYNCASTLQEALDSLYAQTYQNFEIILCDDGSKDNTYQIAYENQQKHPNIVLLKNFYNMGLNQTLNNCLAEAKGEYCARMDGDDICDPTRFEKEVNFLDTHPEYAIVSAPIVYFDENGIFRKAKIKEGAPQISRFNYGPPHPHASCMVRTEAYKAVGGYTVDKKLLRIEDYNLWMKMYAAGYRGYNLGEHLYSMRDNRNAIRRRTFRSRLNAIYAHFLAYKTFNLSLVLFLKYSIVSLIKGAMPFFIYSYLHKRVNRVQ